MKKISTTVILLRKASHDNIFETSSLADKRNRGSSPGRIKNVLLSTSSKPALVSTEPLMQWVPGDFPRGPKWSGREANYAEVKKTWIHTSTPPYIFMAQCLVEERF
jgi:hypothetical protein